MPRLMFRHTAFLLSLAVSLPNSAFALKQIETTESAGVEELAGVLRQTLAAGNEQKKPPSLKDSPNVRKEITEGILRSSSTAAGKKDAVGALAILDALREGTASPTMEELFLLDLHQAHHEMARALETGDLSWLNRSIAGFDRLRSGPNPVLDPDRTPGPLMERMVFYFVAGQIYGMRGEKLRNRDDLQTAIWDLGRALAELERFRDGYPDFYRNNKEATDTLIRQYTRLRDHLPDVRDPSAAGTEDVVVTLSETEEPQFRFLLQGLERNVLEQETSKDGAYPFYSVFGIQFDKVVRDGKASLQASLFKGAWDEEALKELFGQELIQDHEHAYLANVRWESPERFHRFPAKIGFDELRTLYFRVEDVAPIQFLDAIQVVSAIVTRVRNPQLSLDPASQKNIESRVKGIPHVLVQLSFERLNSGENLNGLIQRIVGPYLAERKAAADESFSGFSNALKQGNVQLPELYAFLLELTHPDAVAVAGDGRSLFRWGMQLFFSMGAQLRLQGSLGSDVEILNNANEGYQHGMAAGLNPFQFNEEIGLPIVAAAKKALGLPAAGMEDELEPEQIQARVDAMVDVLGGLRIAWQRTADLGSPPFDRFARGFIQGAGIRTRLEEVGIPVAEVVDLVGAARESGPTDWPDGFLLVVGDTLFDLMLDDYRQDREISTAELLDTLEREWQVVVNEATKFYREPVPFDAQAALAFIEKAARISGLKLSAAGTEETLAEKLRKSGGFGFVAGRGRDYSTLATWKQVAGFAGQAADRGAVPKIDIQPLDELGLEVLEQFRNDRPDGLVGVALYKASQAAKVIKAAGGHDLIITAPAAEIAGVVQKVTEEGAAGNVLVIAKVTGLAEAEAAVAAGARGIEVEPVNEAVLQEVRAAAERLNLLVVGTADGVTKENAERLLALADYVGFSVSPDTLHEKLQWNTVARYAARWVLVNRGDLEIEEESLEALQRRLQKPEVTSGSGVRARVLTGEGETYDAIVLDQFPTQLVPELQQGLSGLLAQLNAAGSFSWLDGAGGLGAALREGRNLYPNLSPVLIDAVQWRPDQFTDAIRQTLEAQAAARGIDLWAPGQATFLEAHLRRVDLSSLQGPPAKLFTMMNALGYNKDPLGLLVNMYNQLPEGALLLANLYIPTDHAMAEKLVRFYERLFAQLKSPGIADLKVTDFQKMNGIDLNHQLETGPFPEFGLGIVLKKEPGQLKLGLRPYSEPFQIYTKRKVEYEVAWYGEDPSQVLTYEPPSAGAEEAEEWRQFEGQWQQRFRGLHGNKWNRLADLKTGEFQEPFFDEGEADLARNLTPIQYSLLSILFTSLPAIERNIENRNFAEARAWASTTASSLTLLQEGLAFLRSYHHTVERQEAVLDLKVGAMEAYQAELAQLQGELEQWEVRLRALSAAGVEESISKLAEFRQLAVQIRRWVQDEGEDFSGALRRILKEYPGSVEQKLIGEPKLSEEDLLYVIVGDKGLNQMNDSELSKRYLTSPFAHENLRVLPMVIRTIYQMAVDSGRMASTPDAVILNLDWRDIQVALSLAEQQALISRILEVTRSPPAAGAEEIPRERIAAAVEQFRAEWDPAKRQDPDLLYYLEGEGTAFAPALALLETGKQLGLYSFVGVVETRRDYDRLAAVLEANPAAQQLLPTRILVIEEQPGADRQKQYDIALKKLSVVTAGMNIRRVTTLEQDLLAQLNRILAGFGYHLPEDATVREAALTLLQAA